MKRFIFIFLCAAVLMSCFVLPAAADTVDEGTVNSTALNYFTGIVNKLEPNCHYVVYRTGDYTTAMAYGFDLSLSNNTITSSDCTVIVYNQRGSGSGTTYTPTVSFNDLTSFSLSTSDKSIIYSSLGSWPSLGDSNKNTISYILWAIVFFIFVFIAFKLFRNRRHYINL